jgi:hypothetical protein
MTLKVGFGWGTAIYACVGVNERQVLALLFGKAWCHRAVCAVRSLTRFAIHLCPKQEGETQMSVRYCVELSQAGYAPLKIHGRPLLRSGFSVSGVALCEPSVDLSLKGRLIFDALIEALLGEDGKFRFGHIQPAAVLGRVMPLFQRASGWSSGHSRSYACQPHA